MAIKKATKPLRFQVVDASAPWTGWSMMLYGSPGSGKTFLAGTAVQVPEMQKVLLLDNDGGSRTVRGKSKFTGISVVNMIDCDTSVYNEVFRWLVRDKRVDGATKEALDALGRPEEFRTIIVDNLGALHWATIQQILNTVTRNRADDETPNQADYGTARSRMLNLQKNFAKFSEASGVTFIFTCHVDIMKTEYETVSKMRPAIPGKLGYELPGDLPIVGYLEVGSGRKKIGQAQSADEGERAVHFDPRANAKIEVKDQSETLGVTIRNPTMAKIYAAVKGLK